MNTSTKPKPDYKNEITVGFWSAKNGSGYTCYVSEDVAATLKSIPVGSRLFLGETKPELKAKNARMPDYRVKVFLPVAEETTAQSGNFANFSGDETI